MELVSNVNQSGGEGMLHQASAAASAAASVAESAPAAMWVVSEEVPEAAAEIADMVIEITNEEELGSYIMIYIYRERERCKWVLLLVDSNISHDER